jgi:hypothetical protein
MARFLTRLFHRNHIDAPLLKAMMRREAALRAAAAKLAA